MDRINNSDQPNPLMGKLPVTSVFSLCKRSRLNTMSTFIDFRHCTDGWVEIVRWIEGESGLCLNLYPWVASINSADSVSVSPEVYRYTKEEARRIWRILVEGHGFKSANSYDTMSKEEFSYLQSLACAVQVDYKSWRENATKWRDDSREKMPGEKKREEIEDEMERKSMDVM